MNFLKKKINNPLYIFSKIVFGLIIFICIFSFIFVRQPQKVKADSDYYSNLNDDELSDLFKLSASNLGNIWDWISNYKTYTIIEDTGSGYIYWWNSPNIQQSAINSAYDIVLNSGYGGTIGTDPATQSFIVNVPGNNGKATTALERYGFKIPNTAYLGERPLITISISGVLKPDGFWDGVGRLIKFVFTGELIDCPTQDDYNSLSYVAPNDYVDGANTFETWVSNNWDNFITYVADGAILHPNASKSSKGEYNGLIWVKDAIINKNGLQNKHNEDHESICSDLQQICGAEYGNVATCIILQTIKASENENNGFSVVENPKTQRIMPYDLTRLNSKDTQIFDGVVDHRAIMQNSLYSSGYDKMFTNYFKQALMTFSGKLAEITVSINNCGNFNFIEGIGLDPTILWTNEIIQFLVILMMIIFVFYLIKAAIKVLTGKGTSLAVVSKSVLIFIMCLCIYCFAKTPDETYNFIKNMSSTLFSFSNVTLSSNDSLNNLYGSGDAHAKENCSLWLPYFNTWTIYNTNHSLTDSSQTINIKSGSEKPEEIGISIPSIGGKQQNLWCTLLADTATIDSKYSNNVYRMIDHFMAPRITPNNIGKQNIDITVTQNENYNGNVQTTLNFSSLLWQLLLLLCVIIKIILFYEFVLNIALLFFDLSLVVFDQREIMKVLKILGASAVNVFFVNIYCVIIIWVSLISSGIVGVIIGLFFFYISAMIVLQFAKFSNNNPFKPKILKAATKALNKAAGIFR